MKSVTVKLQDGLVVVETDPAAAVLPADLWKEIQRVGFLPDGMEIRAEGLIHDGVFEIDGRQWRLVNAAPSGKRKARLKIIRGSEEPPTVEFIE